MGTWHLRLLVIKIMSEKKISVVLSTYNEEKNIGECLESIRQLADEMVVVDGSSVDKTREIARSYGARVFKTTNPPIFHINKNKAIDKATEEWILQLDADERVTPELAKEIKEVINSNDKFNGYWLPRKNLFLGKFLSWGGQYPDYTMRLYKNGKGRLPAKDVHEQAEVEGQVSYLKNNLLHLADPDFQRYWERNNRYINLLASQLKDGKVDKNIIQFINYFLIKPIWWFLLTQIRHKGILDGWQGIVFSFFSSLRFPRAYWRYLKKV